VGMAACRSFFLRLLSAIKLELRLTTFFSSLKTEPLQSTALGKWAVAVVRGTRYPRTTVPRILSSGLPAYWVVGT